jgi:hypothetical protein
MMRSRSLVLGLGLLSLGLLSVACGSSSGGSDAAAGSGGGAAGTGGGGAGGGGAVAFVTGDLDGVTIRGEDQAVAYYFDGLLLGSIAFQAHASGWDWYFVIGNNTYGNACSGGYGQVTKTGDTSDGFASFQDGATCTVTLTHDAQNVGDVLEGTFSGTWLAITGTGMKTITNGSFRVPRIADGQPPR